VRLALAGLGFGLDFFETAYAPTAAPAPAMPVPVATYYTVRVVLECIDFYMPLDSRFAMR